MPQSPLHQGETYQVLVDMLHYFIITQTASKNCSNTILICLAYYLAIFLPNHLIPFGWSQESNHNYIIFSNFLLISLSSYLMINMKVLSMQTVFFAYCTLLASQ